MSEASDSTEPTSPPRGVVGFERARDRPRSAWAVLFSPRRAFIGQRDKARPWWILAFVTLVSLAQPAAFIATTDLRAFIETEMKKSGQTEDMPPEALEAALDYGPKFMAVALPGGAAAKRAGWALIIAALGFAFLRGSRKELRFRTCLAAVALGCAPLLINDVVSALVFLLRESHEIDVRNPVLSNPAAWLKLDVERDAAGAALRSLDLFELWSAYLMALGLVVVANTRSRSPFLLTFGGHFLVAIAAIAGAFAAGATG
jgi:hypothetical protein